MSDASAMLRRLLTVRRPLILLTLVAALVLPASTASATELGLNINGAITGGTPENFADLQALNSKWARHFLFWDDIDAGGLRYYDAMAAEEDKIGVKTMITVMSARGQQPGDKQGFADFMGRLAARLKGRVEAYEVWNEADEGLFWNGGPQPAAYVDLLKRSYAAIKAADPAATVVFSPTVGNNFGYVEAAYAAGAKGNFDAMAVHTDTACLDAPPDKFYRESDGRVGRFTFLAFREVHESMVSNGDGDKPIWMTEFGWSAARHTCEFGEGAGQKPAGVPEDDQAKYLLQAMNCMEPYPYMQTAFWYNNRDLSDDGKMANMYGLRRFSGAERPAFGAFRTFASGGGRSDAACGDFNGPSVEIVQPQTGAVLPPGSPLYIRAKSGAGDLRRIRFRVPGSSLFPDGLRTLAPEPGGEGEITWREAEQLPVGKHTLEVVAFDEAGNGGPPATLEFEKVGANAPGAAGNAAQFPSVRMGGRGQTRTISAGPLPGVLGGAVRIEFWTKRKRGKRRKWVRVHAVTKSARSPIVVRQRLRFRGRWRVRMVYLGKPPVRLTVSCWMYFSTRSTKVKFKCPRGTVPFPSRRR